MRLPTPATIFYNILTYLNFFKMIKVVSSFVVLLACAISLNAQTLITGQDSNTPLYTKLTENILKPYNQLFTKEGFDMDKMVAFREFLKPYAMQNDPMGMFMYAKAHDLYPFKKGNVKDAAVALEYFEKASNLGMADASYMLYGHYRNGYMNLPKDSYKSLQYLNKVIDQGSDKTKAAMLVGLARLYQSTDGETGVNQEFPAVSYNNAKAKQYLAEALKYNPDNGWAKNTLETMK